MPYQNSAISSEPFHYARPETSHKAQRASARMQTGDRANSVLIDLVGFVTLFVAMSLPWWSAALMSSPNSLISVADQLIWNAFASIAALLVIRSQLRLLGHSRDAWLLGAASFVASFLVMSAPGLNADAGGNLAAFATALSCGVCAAVCRLAIGVVLKGQTKIGYFKRRIAIYGATKESALCLDQLAGDTDTVLVGIFDDRKSTDRLCDFGIEVQGGFEDLVTLAASRGLDEVIIAMPEEADQRAVEIAERLSDYPVRLRSQPSTARKFLGVDVRFQLSRLGNVELADVATPPLEGWSLALKVFQDRVGAALLLLLFSPIMLLIALAIKLDSKGPVFFRQRRHGLSSQTITVWKFRTMSVQEDGETITQAKRRDTRVTTVGRLLRKSSLDELPQLFNVLLGDMSLVGPRPHAIAHNEHYAQLIRAYNGRNRLKPGITGWAQINGLRGEISEPSEMTKRVELDHWYIKNVSIWLDLKILLLTPIYGFFHRKAY